MDELQVFSLVLGTSAVSMLAGAALGYLTAFKDMARRASKGSDES